MQSHWQCRSGSWQRIGRPHRVHQGVRVDEDHEVAALRRRDSSITLKCSSHSGSASGPGKASQAWKNSRRCSVDSKGSARCRRSAGCPSGAGGIPAAFGTIFPGLCNLLLEGRAASSRTLRRPVTQLLSLSRPVRRLRPRSCWRNDSGYGQSRHTPRGRRSAPPERDTTRPGISSRRAFWRYRRPHPHPR